MRPRRPTRKFGSLVERRRRFVYRRLLLIAFFAGLIFTVFVWLVTREQFEIRNVAVSGVQSYNPISVDVAVREYIIGAYAGIIPKSNFFFVPKEEIKKALLSRFTNFKSVSVSREGLQALSIVAVERVPDSKWCRQKTSKIKEECFLIDSDGYVFSTSTKADSALFSFYGYLDTFSNPIGKQYLPTERFNEIHSFLGALKAVNFSATSLNRTEDGEYYINLERGTELIIKEATDLNHALSNLSSLLNDKELKELFNRTPLPFEYIDLRLDNKVFYKRR